MKTSRKLLIGLVIALVVLALLLAWAWRGNPSDRPITATMGEEPELLAPEKERIPTVGLAEPVGWKANERPAPGEGLAVARFADGLAHPRTLLTLPNGDVLVAETNSPPRDGGGITGFFMRVFLGRVGAGEPSPNRIVLLRDADRDGRAEQRFTFREANLASPSGMAFGNGRFYVANHDAVLAFDFTPGATSLRGEPTKLMDLPAAGNHWMRNLALSPDGTLLYVAVGSASNIGEQGMEAERGRAGIWEIHLETGGRRQFAGGMRNPNGMAWNPSTGELWTVVQERDLLGPDLVPDYLTNVPVGAQYGWPWLYWKDILDERVDAPIPQFLPEYTRRPEYALGAHTSALGLRFSAAGNRMGEAFGNGAFIARHGSWNRKPLVGYDVIFVPFDERGNPQGEARPVLTGFLTPDGEARGRPVWLEWDSAGALLVSDDTAGVIWRVLNPRAEPAPGPAAVASERMPPQEGMGDDPDAAMNRIRQQMMMQ